jgi:hypothetical protein
VLPGDGRGGGMIEAFDIIGITIICGALVVVALDIINWIDEGFR